MQRIHAGDIGDVVYMRVYWNNAGHGFFDPRSGRFGNDPPDAQLVLLQLAGRRPDPGKARPPDGRRQLGQRARIRSRPTAWGAGRSAPTRSYGQSFDHYFVEFEYPDGTRMISQCRDHPNCWDACSEHIVGTKGIVRDRRRPGSQNHRPQSLELSGTIWAAAASILIESSTRSCWRASAAATRSTNRNMAPKAP